MNNLVFRTSPGMLYSVTQPYTHAVISFRDCPPLEAHVGVRVQGKSGILHECDVLILSVAKADLSRCNEVAPRGTRSLIAIECKYYAGASITSSGARFPWTARGSWGKESLLHRQPEGTTHPEIPHRSRPQLGKGVVPSSQEGTILLDS